MANDIQEPDFFHKSLVSPRPSQTDRLLLVWYLLLKLHHGAGCLTHSVFFLCLAL